MDKMTIEEYLQTSWGKGMQYRIKGLKTLPIASINHLDEQPEWLTHQQVADFIGLSKGTIKKYVGMGFFQERDGFVLKQSLIEWIDELCRKP
jgi:response regulator of citrate/malate metabolism